MSNCTNCKTQTCTCSGGTVITKAYDSVTPDCGCDNTEDCCVDTKTSCIEYNGGALDCFGVADASTTAIALQVVLDAMNTRMCSILEEYEACCAAGSDYDLSVLVWDCLTEPAPPSLENVLQTIINQVETNIMELDASDFVVTSDGCKGRSVSINDAEVAQDVSNYIINNYLTEISNAVNYRIFPDEDCAKEFIADGFSVEAGSGLTIERRCYAKYTYTFTFNSTNTLADTLTHYKAPNGIIYELETAIALNDTAAIIAWFLDTLGLTVTITPYAYPVYEIIVQDYGTATFVPELQLVIGGGAQVETHDSETVDTGDICCKLHIDYVSEAEGCCDDCPPLNIVGNNSVRMTPEIVNKVTMDSSTAVLATYTSRLTSLTINGLTYTPASPIEFSDTTALDAFLATIEQYTVTVDYTNAPSYVIFTVVGYGNSADLLDTENSHINFIYNDGAIETPTEANFDNPVVDSASSCTLYNASISSEVVALSITYEAGWTSSDVTLRRVGDVLYITGGTITRTGDVVLDALTLFTLPAGLESASPSTNHVYGYDAAVSYTKSAILRNASSSLAYILDGFGAGITGDTIEIPNIAIFLATP